MYGIFIIKIRRSWKIIEIPILVRRHFYIKKCPVDFLDMYLKHIQKRAATLDISYEADTFVEHLEDAISP